MKLTIKKLMILALALVMALSMCACAGNDRDDDDDDDDDRNNRETISDILQQPTENETIPVLPADPEPMPTIITEPAEPTEEELAILNEYAWIQSELRYASDEQVEYYYEWLRDMDRTALDKWAGTEYAPAELDGNVIEWDYDAMMARFAVLENVLLTQTMKTTDFVGNERKSGYEVEWYYDADGQISRIENEYYAFKMIQDNVSRLNGDRCYTFDENGVATEIRFGYGYEDAGDEIFNTEYLMVRTKDENGNVILETVTDTRGDSYEIHYTYDMNSRLATISYGSVVYTYTYDEAGRLIRSECASYKRAYDTDIVDQKDIMEYTYDENGHLVSGQRSQEKWEYTVDKIEHGWLDYEYFVSDQFASTRATDTYAFTCDAQGNLLHITVTPGDTLYLTGNNAGTVKYKAQYAAMDYEFTYGEYVTYQHQN